MRLIWSLEFSYLIALLWAWNGRFFLMENIDICAVADNTLWCGSWVLLQFYKSFSFLQVALLMYTSHYHIPFKRKEKGTFERNSFDWISNIHQLMCLPVGSWNTSRNMLMCNLLVAGNYNLICFYVKELCLYILLILILV